MSSRHPLSHLLFSLLLLATAGLYLFLALNREADPDEYQSLVNGYHHLRGEVLYTDFWDNHGPGTTLLLAPLLHLWPEDHNVMLVVRLIMWGCTLVTALVVAHLSLLVSPGRTLVATGAALLYLWSIPVMGKSIEIRPDVFGNLLWAGALYQAVAGMKSRSWKHWLAAGLLIGLYGFFSIKLLLLLSALFFSTVLYLYYFPRPVPVRQTAVFLGGIAAVLLCMVIYLALAAMLKGFRVGYLGSNVGREWELSLSDFYELFQHGAAWMTLSVLALVYHARASFSRPQNLLQHVLWPCAFWLLFQWALLLPTKFLQSLLAAQVPQAVLNALFLAWAWERIPALKPRALRLVQWLFVPAAALASLSMWQQIQYYGRPTRTLLPGKIAFANDFLRKTGRDEFVFDPSGIVFLRLKPGPFKSIVRMLRHLHNERQIDLDLPGLLQRYKVRYVAYDLRLSLLRPEDIRWIHANYLPFSMAPRSSYAGTAVGGFADYPSTTTLETHLVVPAHLHQMNFYEDGKFTSSSLGKCTSGPLQIQVPGGAEAVAWIESGAATRTFYAEDLRKWSRLADEFAANSAYYEDRSAEGPPRWYRKFMRQYRARQPDRAP